MVSRSQARPVQLPGANLPHNIPETPGRNNQTLETQVLPKRWSFTVYNLCCHNFGQLDSLSGLSKSHSTQNQRLLRGSHDAHNWCLAGPRWKHHLRIFVSTWSVYPNWALLSPEQNPSTFHHTIQSSQFSSFCKRTKKHIVGYSKSWDCSNAHAGVKSTSAKSCKARLRHQNVASWFQHLRHLSTYLYLIWLNYIHL